MRASNQTFTPYLRIDDRTTLYGSVTSTGMCCRPLCHTLTHHGSQHINKFLPGNNHVFVPWNEVCKESSGVLSVRQLQLVAVSAVKSNQFSHPRQSRKKRYPQFNVKFGQHGRYDVTRDLLLLPSIFSQGN
jgi:hypothetical protein